MTHTSKISHVAILAVILAGCLMPGDDYFFRNPMPESVPGTNGINPKLIGTYEDLTHPQTLFINAHEIVVSYAFNINFPMAELDSLAKKDARDTTFRDGQSIDTIRIRNDSLFTQHTVYDTLVAESEAYTLKKYKGFYFTNKKMFNGKWTVRTFRITAYGVLVSKPLGRKELESLEDYTTLESDSIKRIKPSEAAVQAILDNVMSKKESFFVRTEYGLAKIYVSKPDDD